MTFQEELILTILDKAIIGGLIAVAAFLFSRSLERFKSVQALSTEYAKQRLSKIAELWGMVHAWEADVIRLSWVFRRAIGHKRPEATVAEATESSSGSFAELTRHEKAVKSEIQRNQFWLGEDLLERFLSHYQAILDHIGNMSGDDLAAAVSDEMMERLEIRLRASRQSIFSYVEPPVVGQKSGGLLRWNRRRG